MKGYRLRRQLSVVESELEGAKVVIYELASTWWGRIALRLALRRIERG